MTNLVDIIKAIITAIGTELKISSVTDSTLFVCDTTGWVTINKVITIDGLNYKVIDLDYNVSITVEPFEHTTAVPLDTTVINQHEITCFHGEPASVNEEYELKDEYTSDKTPFVWLFESYDYGVGAVDSAFAAEFNPKIFLLDWTQAQQWNNDQHNNYVVKPMENLAKMITDYVKKRYDFKTPSNTRIKTHTRFGTQLKHRGDNKKIIDEDLSGVELDIDLKLYNLDICKC